MVAGQPLILYNSNCGVEKLSVGFAFAVMLEQGSGRITVDLQVIANDI